MVQLDLLLVLVEITVNVMTQPPLQLNQDFAILATFMIGLVRSSVVFLILVHGSFKKYIYNPLQLPAGLCGT